MENGKKPYQKLGQELVNIRTRMQESQAEVSGAVEIETETLTLFEQGYERPSEDILDLLISHFSIKDQEATRLWKLAGYDDQKGAAPAEDVQIIQQPIMLLPFDTRIMYTDAMNVTIDDNGVVLNFMQGNAVSGQQMPAARLGMSLEYAQKVVDTLSDTLKKAHAAHIQKHLPAPKKDSKDNA